MKRPRKPPPKIDTRSARAKLAAQDKPYYVDASRGVDIGYRRPVTGPGSWYVRALNGEGGYWVKRTATADDVEPANGKDVLSYAQALDLARKIARGESGDDAGSDKPLTVDAAIDLYLGDLKARGQNPVNATQIKFHMTRKLGTKVLSMTHPSDWREWRDGILAKGAVKAATCNRLRKSCHAMCNLAGKLDARIAANARAWKAGFEHLPGADQPREGVILTDDVVRKIVAAIYAAAGDAVGRFIETMAQAGTRPSQLARVNVGDLLDGNRLAVPVSRKGRGSKRTARTPVPVSADPWRRLREAAGDHGADEPLFNVGGRRFAHRDYARPFRRVVASLDLDDKTVTAYSLRHSAIVRALLQSVPVRVIAASCDTSVGQIERSYSKFISDYADAVARRSLLDLAEPAADVGNVVPLSPRRP
jgi:integrase